MCIIYVIINKTNKYKIKKILVLNVTVDVDKFLIRSFLKNCYIVFMNDVKSNEDVFDFDFVYMHNISFDDLNRFKETKEMLDIFNKVMLGSVLTPLHIVDNHNVIFFKDWNPFQSWFYDRINQN